MKSLLRSLSFPLFLIVGLGASAVALENGAPRLTIILPLIVITLLYNLAVEGLIPHRLTLPSRPYSRDTLFTVFNIFVTAKYGELLLVALLAPLAEKYLAGKTVFDTASLGPLWLQAAGAMLLNELIRYWAHFAQHKIPALWKFHAIHHSVGEIYSLNTFYSHPLDYFIRNSTAWPVIFLLGFSPDAVLLATAFVTIGGVFSHSRADLNHGWLNYVFSTNQLHRWHHSVEINESDRNFGVCICLWDLVFGTHYLPKDREVPAATGLHAEHPAVPRSFPQVLAFPVVAPRA